MVSEHGVVEATDQMDIGKQMYAWASDLFSFPRSLTGDGVRQTLNYLHNILPELNVYSIDSGSKVFDWEIPDEWNIREAYVADDDGFRIVDLADSNLHVVGYSVAIDQTMSFEELDKHVHSLPDQPDAIPYVTSYYHRQWGICMTERLRTKLRQEPLKQYHIKIETTLSPGELLYGELIVPGKTENEVLLSTYLCHPSMANDNLSGLCVQTAVAKWIQEQLTDRRNSYRVLFVPETLGALAYLSRNIEVMKTNTIAGFVLSCIGDDRSSSCVSSRKGDTVADRVAEHVLKYRDPNYQKYTFLDRGSDERQYCSPGVDLPVCTLMRSKFETFPEYHTSLDDLSVISPEGLRGGYDIVRDCISLLEGLGPYECTTIGEPQLGRRGLYPELGLRDTYPKVRSMMNVIAYSDGKHDLIEIADLLSVDARELIGLVGELVDHKVLRWN
jgi:aminopeptidase-like protein